MNKFYNVLFVGLIITVALIFFATQKDSIVKSWFASPTPALPPDQNSLQFNLLTPNPKGPSSAFARDPNAKTNTARPTFGVEEGVKASYSATIKTSQGDIVLTLFGSKAPNTVKNFVDKAKSDYYKNLTFHRVEDWVIQGGDPQGDGSGGGPMKTELNTEPFVTGSLGVAGTQVQNSGIISNDSQFFITKTDADWLNQKYTNFGIVTDGMDVVNKIKIGDKILGITIE